MRHTLTTVFTHHGDAQHALNKLLAAGFERADIALSPARPAGQGGTEDMAGVARERGRSASGRQLFTELLGMHDHPDSAPDAVAGGRHLLTVSTGSAAQARRAAELIGPLSAHGGDDPMRCIHSLSEKSGTSFGRRVVGPSAPRESAIFDDALAARRYGHDMHHSEKYRNRSWDEVGQELVRGWALRHPGASNRDRSEAAIHGGWDDAHPDIDEDSYYRTQRNAPYAHETRHQDPGSGSARDEQARNSFQYHLRHRTASVAGRKASWTSQHAGELPPWERFKDALLHGWRRIHLGNDEEEHASPADAANGKGAMAPRHGWRRAGSSSDARPRAD